LFAIDKVATGSLSFDAEFFLWLKWTGDLDTENIVLLNELKGGERVELRRRFPPDRPGEPGVKWISYKVKGTYEAEYDLKRFPFDTQRLVLTVAHKNKNANKIQLVIDHDALSERSLERWPHAWLNLGRRDYSGTFNYMSTFGNPTYKKGEKQADFSVNRTELVIDRRLFTYVITLFLPLGLLTCISMIAILTPMQDSGPRSSIILTSLLGVLLQHLGFARSMPKVGHLVAADFYFLAAYVFLSMLALHNCAIRNMVVRKQDERARKWEWTFAAFYLPAILTTYGLITFFALRGG